MGNLYNTEKILTGSLNYSINLVKSYQLLAITLELLKTNN